jgi:hypothetical protein
VRVEEAAAALLHESVRAPPQRDLHQKEGDGGEPE